MDDPLVAPNTQQELLHIARDAIRAELDGMPYRPPDTQDPALRRVAGAFVTLHAAGALRGCIGTLEGTRPLAQAVAELARSAAFHDPRFPALSAAEWPAIQLEISVLSPLRPVSDPQEVQVGRHGLVLSQGGQRGVLLPQVAVEYRWDRETFLEHTCRKAGLPPDAWRRGARIEVFEAQVFGEAAPFA